MNKNKNIDELQKLLDKLDSSDIYRSVYDLDGNVLAEGVEPLRDQLVNDYKLVDFRDKTVVDLGCGFGFFSFLAAKQGAAHVTGVDCVREIVDGATILADLHEHSNVQFREFNFEQPVGDLGVYDLAMLVDFFGKSNIRKKKVQAIVEFIKTLSHKELLFAVRPINRIKQDLKMTVSEFSALYPSQYIRDDSFFLLEYIDDILGDEWQLQAVSGYDGTFRKHKLLFLCRRISDHA